MKSRLFLLLLRLGFWSVGVTVCVYMAGFIVRVRGRGDEQGVVDRQAGRQVAGEVWWIFRVIVGAKTISLTIFHDHIKGWICYCMRGDVL